MTSFRRAACSVACALIVGFWSVGVSGTALAEQPAIYDRGNWGEPESLDPHKAFTVAEETVLRDLFEGLVIHDAEGRIAPGAARDWTLSEDGLLFTFRLRDDARWSNGDPVTANDFAFAFRRLLDPATAAPFARQLFAVRNAQDVHAGAVPPERLGVEARSERALDIHLERPTPTFLDSLAHMSALPVHAASLETAGARFTAPGTLVSNGAYRLVARQLGGALEVERNPAFHDAENVAIPRVRYFAFDDESACQRRFEAREVLSCETIPAGGLAGLQARLGQQVRVFPSLTTVYVTLDLRRPPFDDARVRRALSLMTDRAFLAEKIWDGAAVPQVAWVPPGVENYASHLGEIPMLDHAGEGMIEREDEALALMKAAGHTPETPLTISLAVYPGDSVRGTTVALADMWRPLGVVAEPVVRDFSAHFGALREGAPFDAALTGWIADRSDPEDFLALARSDNAVSNYGDYTNSAFDALMKEAEGEADLAERARLLAKAEAILLKDMPNIPLLIVSSRSLVSHRLEGWVDNVRRVHPSRFLMLRDDVEN